MKKIKTKDDEKRDTYLRQWKVFYIKQSVEKVCFEYSCDKNIFLENPILDLDYIKKILKEYNINYSKKDYDIIFKKAKKSLIENGIIK